MVLSRVIPAQSIQQVHIFRRRLQILVLQHVDDPIKDLEELLLNASLCLDPTALEPCQIVSRLHQVVSQGALQPLDHVCKSYRVVGQLHCEIDQVKPGRATKPID